ncbi:MAG: hypothetical protein DCC75_06060 [Proteobacteria bacterium]|nr:MAG: hypothetical protein DCC75_06060 [Pseudomonadota bacterium]
MAIAAVALGVAGSPYLILGVGYMQSPVRSNSNSGAALMELALVAPLLLILIGGVITIGGGMMHNQQQLTDAVATTARLAAATRALSEGDHSCSYAAGSSIPLNCTTRNSQGAASSDSSIISSHSAIHSKALSFLSRWHLDDFRSGPITIKTGLYADALAGGAPPVSEYSEAYGDCTGRMVYVKISGSVHTQIGARLPIESEIRYPYLFLNGLSGTSLEGCPEIVPQPPPGEPPPSGGGGGNPGGSGGTYGNSQATTTTGEGLYGTSYAIAHDMPVVQVPGGSGCDNYASGGYGACQYCYY